MTSDAAAQAAIGAAARELRLPTVRDQAARLAEIAAREHATYLAYLAEAAAGTPKRGHGHWPSSMPGTGPHSCPPTSPAGPTSSTSSTRPSAGTAPWTSRSSTPGSAELGAGHRHDR
jgi:hypothetical protein